MGFLWAECAKNSWSWSINAKLLQFALAWFCVSILGHLSQSVQRLIFETGHLSTSDLTTLWFCVSILGLLLEQCQCVAVTCFYFIFFFYPYICDELLWVELEPLAIGNFYSSNIFRSACGNYVLGGFRLDLSLWYKTFASRTEGISLIWLNVELFLCHFFALCEIWTSTHTCGYGSLVCWSQHFMTWVAVAYARLLMVIRIWMSWR